MGVEIGEVWLLEMGEVWTLEIGEMREKINPTKGNLTYEELHVASVKTCLGLGHHMDPYPYPISY